MNKYQHRRLLKTGLIVGGGLLIGFVSWAFYIPKEEIQSVHIPMAADSNDKTVIIHNFDSKGHSFTEVYTKVPQRVISTYPGATELLIELGVSQAIQGTVAPYGRERGTLREAYNRLPIIKAPFVPSLEEMYELDPDLIIAWSHHFGEGPLRSVKDWQQRGVNTYIVPGTIRLGHRTVEDTVYPFIEDMGRIFRVDAKAKTYLESLKQRIAVVQSKIPRGSPPKNVIILQSYGNGLYTLYGEEYLISDAAEKAGGHNISLMQMTSVGAERILGFDPDAIVLVTPIHEDGTPYSDAEAIKFLQDNSELDSMRAVREGHVINVPFADINNGNGRVIDAIEKIAQGLYPEAFEVMMQKG